MRAGTTDEVGEREFLEIISCSRIELVNYSCFELAKMEMGFT